MSTLARLAVRYRLELAALVIAVAVIVAGTMLLVDVLAFDWPPMPDTTTATPAVELAR